MISKFISTFLMAVVLCLVNSTVFAQKYTYKGKEISKNIELEKRVERPGSEKELYREEVRFENASSKELTGKDAGLSKSALSGAMFLSSDELRQMNKPLLSGLIMLDMDFVPYGLPEQLKKEGYVIKKDGTLLDKEQQPTLMVYKAHVYALYPENESYQKKTSKLGDAILETLVPEAQAGNPYPMRCATWAWRKTTNNGFCRSITADTWGDAWGPSADGSCGADRPHTRIDYMETRAWAAGAQDRDSCNNCDSEHSRDRWSIGCFWPAYGGGGTSHYVHVNDNGVRGTATATSN